MDDGRIAAASTQVLDQQLQTLTRRRGPELLKGDGQCYRTVEVAKKPTTVVHVSQLVPLEVPTPTPLTSIVS